MTVGGARSARHQLRRTGEIKESAADVLRRALLGQQLVDDGPSIAAQLADHVRNFEAEGAAKKAAEAEAEACQALSPAQKLVRNIAGTATPIPLNGPGVLKAVASGLGGPGVDVTVNQGPA
jgi:hypothetical protein